MKHIKIERGINKGRVLTYKDILAMRSYILNSENNGIILEGLNTNKFDADDTSYSLSLKLGNKINDIVNLVAVMSIDKVEDIFKGQENNIYYCISCDEENYVIYKINFGELQWVKKYWETDDWGNYLEYLGVDPQDYYEWMFGKNKYK